MTEALKKQIATAAAEIIYANEGNYSSVNSDDNGALSVGKVQWHGNRALSLLKTIIQTIGQASVNFLDFALYSEIQNSQNWATRVLTVTEKVAVSKLLDTPQGRVAQDDLARKDIQSYVDHGVNLGIEDPQSLVYYADLENQGGAGASKRVGQAAIKSVGSADKVTLDDIHKAAIADNVMGKYASRRNNVYDKAKKLFIVSDTQTMDNSKTGQGLEDYAQGRLGTPYFYGAKIPDGNLTEAKMDLMHSMYPSTVTTNYIKKARSRGQVGKVNVDCSGLIAGYRQINKGSAQLYSTAKRRMPISQIKDFAIGTVLWKSGHVGVYIGIENGVPMCIEAKGIDHGTVKTKVSSTKWVYGLTFADMEYTYAVTVTGTCKGINPYKEPTVLLKFINVKSEISKVRDTVKWLQWELVEAGYKIDIDGKFGSKTNTALKSFQTSSKLEVDGICGPLTRKALIAD
jgi:hypothetical protein